MPGPRIALASINTTVGDFHRNVDLIVSAARDAAESGCGLVAFPEMALTGYPVEDLALRRSFQMASLDALEHLAGRLATSGCGGMSVVVGYLGASQSERPVDMGPGTSGPRPTNSAAVLRDGRVVAGYDKRSLPNYGVFDEERWFAPGESDCVLEVDGARIGLAICEDLWDDNGPTVRAPTETDLLIAINASPFEVGKPARREDLCRRRAVELRSAIAYVNLVGAQDELVFDGGSIVAGPGGELLVRSPRYMPGVAWFDLGSPPAAAAIEPQASEEVDIYHAVTLGLRDYVQKNGISKVLLGLSGGIDSALVAAIACDALGAENVFGVAMPSRYSSPGSMTDAEDLARRTGLNFRIVPIEPMFAAFQGQLKLTDLAEENLQARIRGVILMAISNQEGQLVLATGNKTEVAVGYSTIYGDAVGGFAPIKDVPKTLVWRLARYRNALATTRGEPRPIPENSITKPPSAELRPGQWDQDSLPEYDLLDAVLHEYVEKRSSAADLVSEGFAPEVVKRVLAMTDRAEYKRRQYPIGSKITELAFGRDRRLPITNRWVESTG